MNSLEFGDIQLALAEIKDFTLSVKQICCLFDWMFVCSDMVLSACSDSSATDWKRNSDQTFTETSRQKRWKILNLASFMGWKSFGLLWNTTGEFVPQLQYLLCKY